MNVKRLAIMYVGGSEDDRGFVKDEAPKLTDEGFAQLVKCVQELDDDIERRKQQILDGQHPVHGVDTVASICVGVNRSTGNALVFVRYEKPGTQTLDIEGFDGDVKIVWQWNGDNVEEALQ